MAQARAQHGRRRPRGERLARVIGRDPRRRINFKEEARCGDHPNAFSLLNLLEALAVFDTNDHLVRKSQNDGRPKFAFDLGMTFGDIGQLIFRSIPY